MYRANDEWVVSATDLVNFLECGRLMELSAEFALDGQPTSDSLADGHVAVLQRRGLEHERGYLESLRMMGRSLAEIPEGSIEYRAAATRDALESRVSVIYQATFLNEGLDGRPWWRGHADFLELEHNGQGLYEPVDTKLARRLKPGAVIQLCQYAAQLAELQGRAPDLLHVQLGDGRRESVPLASVASYFRLAKSRFERALAAFDGRPSQAPDPVAHCAVCNHLGGCDAIRRAEDHLTLVAGLGREQARKFAAAGVHTVAELANLSSTTRVSRVGEHVVDRLRRQASLQVVARSSPSAPPPYELVEPSGRGRGLEALPSPSADDLYLDLEGDPYVGPDGLDYLFGIGRAGTEGTFEFTAFWGHDAEGERQAFEAVMDLITGRLAACPDLHVYHYASYERSAFGRLMGKYGTREDAVDNLFRRGVLVDLYRVVQQGVRVGVESYSIKKLEPLYMPARDGPIVDAGSSIVEYERWLETQDQQILDDIEDYNRSDCESTWRLHRWLEDRRVDAENAFRRPLERPLTSSPDATEAASTDPVDVDDVGHRLAGDLLVAPPRDEAPADHARWVLGHLLEWHRREDKPLWWRFFDIVKDYAPGDLIDDGGCLDLLEYIGVAGTEKRSVLHRYRFDPEQEHKIRVGDRPPDPSAERDALQSGGSAVSPGEVTEINPIAGEIVLKRSATSLARHPVALMDHNVVGSEVLREALRRVAEWSAANGIDAPGRYQAVRDLLVGNPPRIDGVAAGEVLRRDREDLVEAATRLVRDLRDSCLPIQGPPGTGKTATSAQVIVDLVRAGKRVGITANSHAVITTLLDEVMKEAIRRGTPVTAIQRDDGNGSTHPNVTHASSADAVEAALADGAFSLVAGTAWLFARQGMDAAIDYLFVDEAGQMSLANVVAVGTATHNLVLVGDPQQLPQPTKGTHPVGAGVAALEHLLDGHKTVPPDRGLFLESTYRMHPDVCQFVSELSYEGRLFAVEQCAQQQILGAGPFAGSGLRWLPVEHTGNKLSSDEEAVAVVSCYTALVGGRWIDQHGSDHDITINDVLVVAPYNAQVHALGRLLPPGARVGTVDKFQGQQAAAVIVSMATSSADEAPRGLEFLLSANRLNVAVSRARALAVVVASPTLLATKCRTVQQMQLVNGLCRFAELAGHVGDNT
jgi:predicted RecB family nuclease